MDLSIIILSYNTKDITDKCLSLLQLSIINCEKRLKNEIEVIVLDNASIDGSGQMIKSKHSWVKLIPSPLNYGYSKGNNIAFEKATNPVILFLNSDVFVKEDSLEKTLLYFKEKTCGVLGVKLTYENGKLQPSAGNLPTPINTIFWILGLSALSFIKPFHPTQSSYFSSDHEVGWTTGAFFMIKKELFKKVGGFDNNIFMYMDEVDFCKRVERSGYKICFTPSIEIVHLLRASSKSDPEEVLVKEITGIKYYLKKYYLPYYFLVRLFLIKGLILRIIAFSLLGKTKRAKAYVKALKMI